jgi:hypothetical protein
MSHYQQYSVTSTLLFKTLCRVSSHEPASNLVPRRLTLPPSTPQYPCTVFVNMTLVIQLTLWLPRVGRQVTEYCSHYYPNSLIGRCGQQARPAKSPDLTPPWLLVCFWGPPHEGHEPSAKFTENYRGESSVRWPHKAKWRNNSKSNKLVIW